MNTTQKHFRKRDAILNAPSVFMSVSGKMNVSFVGISGTVPKAATCQDLFSTLWGAGGTISLAR